jgi:hypothetical protein
MKERPILFSAPMVRALLAGTKTQTRRVVKPQPEQGCIGHFGPGNPFIRGERDATRCPYGQPGDRLYVREAWRTGSDLDAFSGSEIAEKCVDAGYRKPWAPLQFEADGQRYNWEHTSTPPHDGPPQPGRYRHARFMPRWASRILLEVTAVRVERLQDISEPDAKAEGITTIWPDGPRDDGGPNHFTVGVDPGHLNGPTAATVYRMLWELINGEGSWDANPWVWVVEFKRVTP